MTPSRSERFVRIPDQEFEANLTRAVEEGAKRARRRVPRGQGGCVRHSRSALLGRLHPVGAPHRDADRRSHD